MRSRGVTLRTRQEGKAMTLLIDPHFLPENSVSKGVFPMKTLSYPPDEALQRFHSSWNSAKRKEQGRVHGHALS